ncbi:MAG: hypothetical protein L7W43_03675 [Rubripirellula sp.]|nr:hypothetical protein [Rubripirellula sp.]
MKSTSLTLIPRRMLLGQIPRRPDYMPGRSGPLPWRDEHGTARQWEHCTHDGRSRSVIEANPDQKLGFRGVLMP